MINVCNVKKFCCEDITLIENYNEAVTSNEIWDCHHRLEIQNGVSISPQELNEKGLYYGVEAKYLIFLKHSEHSSLHKKYLRPETKEKMKLNNIGDKNPMFGRKYSHYDETKSKISKTLKGRPSPTKGMKKVWNDESHTSFHYEKL